MFTVLLPFLFYVLGWWPQRDVAADAGRDSGNLIISTDVELVILDVSVKNPNGGYVSGLTADNFQVYEDRKPQQIKHFSHDDIPVTIGLIVDNSGSMRSKRPGVITAALALVEASNPHDETRYAQVCRRTCYSAITFRHCERRFGSAAPKDVPSYMMR